MPSQYGGKVNTGNVCEMLRSSVVHSIKSRLNNYNYYNPFQPSMGECKSPMFKEIPAKSSCKRLYKQTSKQANPSATCLIWKSVHHLDSCF